MSFLKNIFGVQKKRNASLLDAAKKGVVAAVKQSLQDGAEINARDEGKSTPLHWAMDRCSSDATITLLEAGAEVDALNVSQYSPLHWAAHYGHIATVEILLAAGADLTLKNVNGKTPITIARDEKHIELANYLQSIVDDPTKRPTPEKVGLDINKRNTALEALGKPITKPVVGKYTAKAVAGMEAQRQAALNDPSEGI